MICCGRERTTNYCADCGKEQPRPSSQDLMHDLLAFCRDRAADTVNGHGARVWKYRADALAELIASRQPSVERAD